MTNVSKRKATSSDFKVAYEELTKLIAELKSGSASYLIDELLTESEKVMLVKRFAAIFMFKNGFSPYRVNRTIAMSLSTAQRLHYQYDDGDFDKLLSCVKKKDRNKFLTFLENLIMAQVSPRARARLMNKSF